MNTILKILIVEDEFWAIKKLIVLLKEINPDFEIIGTTDSVEGSVEWLENNPMPDLILMDIELADGQSFEIFKKTKVKSPVIFTTSYDEYAIQAFKVNSVNYLLKPIRKDDLEIVINALIHSNQSQQPIPNQQRLDGLDIHKLIKELQIQNQHQKYLTRFLVKKENQLTSIEAKQIAYFYSKEGHTYLVTKNNSHYSLEYSFEQLESLLDPQFFFKVNDNLIIEKEAISQIKKNSNSKFEFQMNTSFGNNHSVEIEKSKDFIQWLDKEISK